MTVGRGRREWWGEGAAADLAERVRPSLVVVPGAVRARPRVARSDSRGIECTAFPYFHGQRADEEAARRRRYPPRDTRNAPTSLRGPAQPWHSSGGRSSSPRVRVRSLVCAGPLSTLPPFRRFAGAFSAPLIFLEACVKRDTLASAKLSSLLYSNCRVVFQEPLN